jgi:hypothetical protein
VKNIPASLKVMGATVASVSGLYGQTQANGAISVPDGGPSVLLLGIAALGCLMFARQRLKK